MLNEIILETGAVVTVFTDIVLDLPVDRLDVFLDVGEQLPALRTRFPGQLSRLLILLTRDLQTLVRRDYHLHMKGLRRVRYLGLKQRESG